MLSQYEEVLNKIIVLHLCFVENKLPWIITRFGNILCKLYSPCQIHSIKMLLRLNAEWQSYVVFLQFAGFSLNALAQRIVNACATVLIVGGQRVMRSLLVC